MINVNDIESLFTSFATTKIGVVGDIMLDTYWWYSGSYFA